MSQVPNEQTLRHIESLKLTIPQYRDWCAQNNFSMSLNKSWKQIETETLYLTRLKATKYLKESNKKISPRKAIEMIRNGNVPAGASLYSIAQSLYNGKVENAYLYSSLNRELFLDVFEFLLTKTRIFETDKYIYPVALMVLEHESWIQSLDSWKPKTYNPDRQFSALLRHLFAKYEVPPFLDSCWFTNSDNVDSSYVTSITRKWFIHVGAGQNIMTATQFINYYPMTKKMAHFFMQAPDNYNLYKAWKYGQVMALGGTSRLVITILETKAGAEPEGLGIGQSSSDNEFTLSVLKFFIDNPMLDMAQVGPIVDYVWNQKYENQRVFVARGQVEDRAPVQPNFTMTGRTVESLMNQVERWHRQLGKESKGGDLQWVHSRYKDYEWQEGSNESRNVKIWRITELLNSKELTAEGRTMHHCVASYAGSCFRGTSSIWAFTSESHEGRLKHLTIEIDLRSKKINQMRGPYNRLGTQKEKQIISRWATREGLLMSTYGI
jgi:hypothetical protein